MNKLQQILKGSKEFKFEQGDNGKTILKLTSYNTGETIKLDLAKLTEEMIEEIIVVAGEENEF